MKTVGELVAELLKFDQSLPVMVKGYEYGWQEAVAPRLAERVALNVNAPGYGGPHEEWDEWEEKFNRQWAKDAGDPEPTVIKAVLLPRS
jgi:hypothetical protein